MQGPGAVGRRLVTEKFGPRFRLRGGTRAAMDEDVTGKPVGQGRLADPPRPRNQPGVGQTAAVETVQKDFLGFFVAPEIGVFPWRQEILHAHATFRRWPTTVRISACTLSGSWAASMTTQRSGLRRAISRKPSRSR